jgi:hypothetical protein
MIAKVPPTTPPAIAPTLGLLEAEGIGVADADMAVILTAQVVDWQVSHDRTTAWQAYPDGQTGQDGAVSGHSTHPRLYLKLKGSDKQSMATLKSVGLDIY